MLNITGRPRFSEIFNEYSCFESTSPDGTHLFWTCRRSWLRTDPYSETKISFNFILFKIISKSNKNILYIFLNIIYFLIWNLIKINRIRYYPIYIITRVGNYMTKNMTKKLIKIWHKYAIHRPVILIFS